MASKAAMEFHDGACDHNRMFKTRGKKVKGCHDLHCLLKAQARGLVVAAVKKLPGDKLPEGVYTVLLTCRKDVDPGPDSSKQQGIVSHGEDVWNKARCTSCYCNNQAGAQSYNAQCNRQGVLFKFEPNVKTIYDPAVWPDKRLEQYCLEAYNEANSMARFNPDGYWEGKFTMNGQEYWMGGYIKDDKIKNFFFIHPDDRILLNRA